MNSASTSPPYAILYVDDEEKALQYFREAFEDEFIIYTATNAWDGYSILREHGSQIGVLISDQRMPGGSGVELLQQARVFNPNLIRILLTAYADYQAAVDAVNAGHVFRYLHKPWDPEDLLLILRHAVDYYGALIERERLLAEKADSVRHMLMADKVASIGILAEGLNHHLRNALTVIRAFIDLAPLKLEEELEGRPPFDPSFWTETHHYATDQIERIQTILSSLSTASNAKQVVRSDFVNLTQILSQNLDIFADELLDRHIHVGIEIETGLPNILVHGERFRQLWRLLFIEELTHLKNGDTLEISALVEPDPTGKNMLVMRLKDTGDWSNSRDPSHLFDPFFVRSGKPDDLGVNMMACYIIVHLHGGTIEAQAGSKSGMDLTICIPLEPEPLSATEDDFFQKLDQHERRWRFREALPQIA